MWFNISFSDSNLKQVEKEMTPLQIEKAQDKSIECVRQNYKEC